MASTDAMSAQHIEALSKSLDAKTHLKGSHAADVAEAQYERAKEREVHVVMMPYPLQGHINPMMQLAKSLIATHHVRVTFVNNKHNHDRISCALASSAHTHDHIVSSKLRLVWLDNGLPSDFDYTDLSWTRLRELHIATSNNMSVPFEHLLQDLNQRGPRVSCVLFGSFCPWASSVASGLGIPSIFFWTQSTSVFSIYYHAPLLAANGFFPYHKTSLPGCCKDDVETDESSDFMVSYIPGMPSLHPSSFPTLLHVEDLSNPSLASIRNQFAILQECDGLIINSFVELEKDALQAIRGQLPFPVYLVGPLIPSAFLDGSDQNDTSVGASLLQEKNDCISWLDSQKEHSVLYVSFGSLVSPSPKDIEAMACGIKRSKQPFLWVIRSASSLQNMCSILPEGFIEDTKDYGLIIPWAPQLQVLSHPSIGAFLTHCGWNSTLESLSMGVPMIPFALFSDQTTNCTYVCDVWKVGMPLRRRVDATITSEAVKRAVRIVLHEEEGKEMRKRARKLREAARQAVLAQGSSSDDMANFVKGMTTQF